MPAQANLPIGPARAIAIGSNPLIIAPLLTEVKQMPRGAKHVRDLSVKVSACTESLRLSG